jgi:hypothetical protein
VLDSPNRKAYHPRLPLFPFLTLLRLSALLTAPQPASQTSLIHNSFLRLLSHETISQREPMVPFTTCLSCGEEIRRRYMPTKIAMNCLHRGHTCKPCIRQWIAVRMETQGWGNCPCPECEVSMEYSDIKRHCLKRTFARYAP